jgi:signal transduction histidine kinase/ActR/RegA family two-component response regulator
MGRTPEELGSTRQRLLRWMLYGLALVGLPAWILHTTAMVQLQMWGNLLAVSLGYWLTVVCALLPRSVPFGVRAAILEILLFGLAVDSLVRFGLAGGGPSLLLTVAVLATVFFGLRSGLFFGMLCIGSMALVGAGFVTGVLELDPDIPATMSSIQAWSAVTSTVATACLALVLAPGLLQRDLLRAMREREQAAKDLVDEALTRAQLQSEKQALSEQLHQAQKMEAVGQLAGGVAHDFNNVLTAIRGNMELALRDLDPLGRAAHRVEASLHSVDRAAELSGRLLAFSRRKVMATSPTSVNSCLRGIAPMLQRLIGEETRLEVRLNAAQDVVMADASQLELVLMNLALNARDAMPSGGLLLLATSNTPHGPATRARPMLVLEVSDTGHGMDAATQERIFEPFFTTKAVGQGTGLGLTMVFNIVQQHGGEIRVSSTPGQGTRFAIQLACVAERPSTEQTARRARPPPRGSELVLLVEDDPMVLETTEAMLEELGYQVDSATNPDEALAYVHGADRPPDLLLTDVVLPGMNGRELAEQLLAFYPELRVVFTSGYTEDDVLRRGVASEKVHFLPKPFSPTRLAQILREALDADLDDFPDITEEVPRGRI